MFEIGEKVICINSSIQPHTIEELTKDMPNWLKKIKSNLLCKLF